MDTVAELINIIKPHLDLMGVELVELQYNRSKRSNLRLYVWEEGGISLDRCSEISREVSDLLDRKDLMTGAYFLEVSSPGLDRPLKSQRDFERQLGRNVKVTIKDEEKTKVLHGRIKSVTDTTVLLDMQDKELAVGLDKIVAAKVLVDF